MRRGDHWDSWTLLTFGIIILIARALRLVRC